MARDFRPRLIGLAGLLVALAGCTSDGHFALLGYTTKPPFDTSIKTVYVPIFGNESYLRGIEFELTKNVIREIESRSPYKVVSSCAEADTILEGRVKSRVKTINNLNQLGEVRDVQQTLTIEVQWKDLRSGDVLSIPNGTRRPQPGEFVDPKAPPMPWVTITPNTSYVPELGGTTASGLDAVVKQGARQIVHMMEIWSDRCGRELRE
jgi:hypothetical protein